MDTKTTIILIICTMIVTCTLILAVAWIFSPTDFQLGVMIDDDTVEVFKLMYNCTGDRFPAG